MKAVAGIDGETSYRDTPPSGSAAPLLGIRGRMGRGHFGNPLTLSDQSEHKGTHDEQHEHDPEPGIARVRVLFPHENLLCMGTVLSV